MPSHDATYVLRKLADQANSTVTRADISGLYVPIEANEILNFEAILFFTAAAATTGLALALNGPAAPASVKASILIPTAAGTLVQSVVSAYETELLSTASLGVTPLLARMIGQVENGPNAGNLAFRFRSEVANSAVTILRGSHVRVDF